MLDVFEIVNLYSKWRRQNFIGLSFSFSSFFYFFLSSLYVEDDSSYGLKKNFSCPDQPQFLGPTIHVGFQIGQESIKCINIFSSSASNFQRLKVTTYKETWSCLGSDWEFTHWQKCNFPKNNI